MTPDLFERENVAILQDILNREYNDHTILNFSLFEGVILGTELQNRSACCRNDDDDDDDDNNNNKNNNSVYLITT